MKIEITEPTRLHLEYLLGKDEKAWAQTIERVIGEIAHIYWLQEIGNTPEQIARCDHRWLKKQQDGSYKCAACDKVIEVEACDILSNLERLKEKMTHEEQKAISSKKSKVSGVAL